jgi:bifunctional enzyme CysN/CysC
MTEAGLIVLCSFISPFRAERQMVRELTQPTEFIEIFVDTPLEECIRRDPKGLYAKARAGRLEHFTGLDSPYEPPKTPELHLTTMGMTPDAIVEHVLYELRRRNII